jgi:hypothetical protein
MKSTVKKLPVEGLTVDPVVQRMEGLDQRRVEKYAANFKAALLGVITVSHRSNGTFVVLDGMHRVATCRQVGFQGTVTCNVFTGLTVAEEAELFFGLNDFKQPSALTKFDMRYKMGDADAVAIRTIAEEHGWTIAPGSTHGYIAAITALERVYISAGGVLPDGQHAELLAQTLEILTAAWEWDSASVHQSMLEAVAQLLGRFGAAVDIKKLIAEMQGTRPQVLIGKARTMKDMQGGTITAAMAKILAGMHNKKRRTNLLPEWVWIR